MLRAVCVSLLFVFPLAAQEAKKPASIVPAPRKDKGWQDRHEKFVAQSKAGNVDVAFIGDSITQGWEGNGKQAWAKEFAPLKSGNYGIGGDQTQHVLWRITEGKELEGISPKVAVMMIGTNNTRNSNADEIAAGVEAIIKELRKQKPELKIILLAVFPRTTVFNPPKDKVSAGELMTKINEINERIAKFGHDKNVFYMDINKVFLDDDGGMSKSIMYDYLHLSPKGYERWAEAILPKVKELLK